MVTRLPLRDDGLRVTIRYEEPWASLLPADQRPVGKEYATLDVVRSDHGSAGGGLAEPCGARDAGR